MILVGDIHGKFDAYQELIRSSRFNGQSSIQIGDFGLFRPSDMPRLPQNAYFFRGNHDNPELCRMSPHYLGDYGYREIDGFKFFWLAGAWSIDHAMRIEGVSWWRDEELSIAEGSKAFDLYLETKPDIVLSHDAPNVAVDKILNLMLVPSGYAERIKTRTGQLLSAMYSAYQPKEWYFGHYHVNWSTQIGRTKFRCLPELGFAEV